MKNYFKIGLMALTLAFGVTSCDKQDNGGAAVNALSLEAQGLANKVSFGESGGMIAPKGFKNLTSKNAGVFVHKYSSDPQTLEIFNDVPSLVWTGEYTPNSVDDLIATGEYSKPIILPNGNYTVATDNLGNDAEGIVLNYLPYTSSASFLLNKDTGVTVLQADLKRGFVIADVAAAIGGDRVTSVQVRLNPASDVNVFTDLSRDDDGDYFGYLLEGEYEVRTGYTLDLTPNVFVNTTVNVLRGSAYTVILELVPETPAGPTTRTVTSTQFSNEEDLATANPARADGGDINGDEDNFDTISRTIRTLFTTPVGGVEDDGVFVSGGSWSIVLDYSTAGFGGDTGTNPADGSIADEADEYLSATTSSSVGGVASTVNDGIAVVTLATATSTVEMVLETTTQATLDNVSEIVETTTTVYTVQINVREDVPALPAKDDLVETETTPATSIAGTPVVTTRMVANPDYSAPDTSTPDALAGDWTFDGTADFTNSNAVGYLWTLQAPIAGNFNGKYLAQFTINGVQQSLVEAQAYAVANGGDSFISADDSTDQADAFVAWANAEIASIFNNL